MRRKKSTIRNSLWNNGIKLHLNLFQAYVIKKSALLATLGSLLIRFILEHDFIKKVLLEIQTFSNIYFNCKTKLPSMSYIVVES